MNPIASNTALLNAAFARGVVRDADLVIVYKTGAVHALVDGALFQVIATEHGPALVAVGGER